MDLSVPTCNHPECVPALVTRACTGRRGTRTVAYEGHGWRCSRCADPDTGEAPLEFVDAQLMHRNEEALRAAWRQKFGEELPPSGRPGRKTDQPRTERVAVLLTTEDLDQIDAWRGGRSRSEFVRDIIETSLRRRSA